MLKFLKLTFFSFFFLNILLVIFFFNVKTKKEKEKFNDSFDQKKVINQTSKIKTNETSNKDIDKNQIRDFVYVFNKEGNIQDFKLGDRTGYRLDGWIDNFKKDTGEITISRDFKNLVPDYRFKISSYTKLQVILGIDKNNQFVTREIDHDELKRGSVVTLICSDKKCNSILSINVINKFAVD